VNANRSVYLRLFSHERTVLFVKLTAQLMFMPLGDASSQTNALII